MSKNPKHDTVASQGVRCAEPAGFQMVVFTHHTFFYTALCCKKKRWGFHYALPFYFIGTQHYTEVMLSHIWSRFAYFEFFLEHYTA